ncbi:hypothetical protein KZZ52_11295 [Dactylosporangium sp. AC04546]|uniref:hypothetical protein n=1 Tax=Dactylosporangium sp. AC04546 TaxID=2862460 RepID=UPI001EE115E3|nr:hypothetical protein [Dactylosporangium sp. AC04546]WVK85933.1 hypothetical protein KZZ52_11295 [Dactylosporangium sp. AC04546]
MTRRPFRLPFSPHLVTALAAEQRRPATAPPGRPVRRAVLGGQLLVRHGGR